MLLILSCFKVILSLAKRRVRRAKTKVQNKRNIKINNSFFNNMPWKNLYKIVERIPTVPDKKKAIIYVAVSNEA
jgi:hypothetical protein